MIAIDLEELAASTAALDDTRRRRCEALSAALAGGYPQHAVAWSVAMAAATSNSSRTGSVDMTSDAS